MLAALTCGFLASCTATSGPGFDMTSPSYTGGGVVSMMADIAQSEEAGTTAEPTQDTAQTASSDGSGGAAKLPEQVATAPANKPVTAETAADGQASALQAEPKTAQAKSETTTPAEDDVAVATVTTAKPERAGTNESEAAKATPAGAEADSENTATAASNESAPQVAAVEEPKKKGFLAYFFSPQPAKATPSPIVKQAPASSAQEPGTSARKEKTPLIDPEEKTKPIIKLASVDPAEKRPVQKAAAIVPMDALPGVRQGSLFEISRKDGIDDDSDIDLNEAEGGVYQVASAAGLARLAPNGLLKARETVDTACLKPALVRMLKTVEQRFGKKLIITSGYRNRDYNRKVRGARNSMHMYCAAADVLMPGVSKWEIAQFVRAMPGRGGVGTYCHTNAVHIDVGPERDWNWRCRRRKAS